MTPLERSLLKHFTRPTAIVLLAFIYASMLLTCAAFINHSGSVNVYLDIVQRKATTAFQ